MPGDDVDRLLDELNALRAHTGPLAPLRDLLREAVPMLRESGTWAAGDLARRIESALTAPGGWCDTCRDPALS